MEIYEESKHGIAYRAHEDDLNMGNAKWVLGEDYTAAPTCATCHMSAVRTADGDLIPVTHDVGLRISWDNRPPLSIRPEVSDKKLGLDKMAKVTWQEIWHHEGRVARHGASMMAPDYTHWHGLYEVAKHWYSKFIPELREIAEVAQSSGDAKKVDAGKKLDAAIDELLARPERAWFTGNLPAAERERRKKAQDVFNERYK